MSDKPQFMSTGHNPLDDIPIPSPPFYEVLKPSPLPNRRSTDRYQPGTPPMEPRASRDVTQGTSNTALCDKCRGPLTR